MPDRALRLGDVIDDYCPRCRLLLNHDVASMTGRQGGQGHLPHLLQHPRLPQRARCPTRRKAKKDDDKTPHGPGAGRACRCRPTPAAARRRPARKKRRDLWAEVERLKKK